MFETGVWNKWSEYERFIHKAGFCIIWMKYEHANWFVKHGFGFKVFEMKLSSTEIWRFKFVSLYALLKHTWI